MWWQGGKWPGSFLQEAINNVQTAKKKRVFHAPDVLKFKGKWLINEN